MPETPGPPGLTSIEPTRWSGSEAGTRSSDRLEGAAVGVVVVEGHLELGALHG